MVLRSHALSRIPSWDTQLCLLWGRLLGMPYRVLAQPPARATEPADLGPVSSGSNNSQPRTAHRANRAPPPGAAHRGAPHTPKGSRTRCAARATQCPGCSLPRTCSGEMLVSSPCGPALLPPLRAHVLSATARPGTCCQPQLGQIGGEAIPGVRKPINESVIHSNRF